MNFFTITTRRIVLKIIRIYQKTLSFDHGPLKIFFPNGYCRFHPTCSEYGYRAIEKYGIFKGGLMAANRVLRCNPWNKGGIDEVK
ncbi:MAG: membrane protein insertion efficiency factor YidD [Candidatus Buchananbacteria bacterium]|nr:membrane protein insertion efficiency factor YidD [Candidatus Buchananbacteria bacterium]